MGFSSFSGQPASDVQAERLTEQRSIITPNGAVTGEEGDWEVREPGGNVRHLTDEEFQAEYGGEATADKEKSETQTGTDPVADSDDKSDNGAHDESATDDVSLDDEDTSGDGTESDKAPETPAAPTRPSGRRR
jgi:hypothetical protein